MPGLAAQLLRSSEVRVALAGDIPNGFLSNGSPSQKEHGTKNGSEDSGVSHGNILAWNLLDYMNLRLKSH